MWSMTNPAANNEAGCRVVFARREETLASARRAADLLGEAYRTYLDSLPPNIRAVRELWLSKLFDCAADGIPIWHVPRTEVIDALMDAGSSEERYAVLDQCRDEIIDDCRGLIEILEPNERPFLSEIAAALESGLWRAAQALAMNVVD